MPSPFSAYSSQYHLYRCLQLHAFSVLCLLWPVSTLLLPTTTCPLLSLPKVTSITSTFAYNYLPSTFSAYSDQYHLYRCLQLRVFSFLCIQWSVSSLPLPTATCLVISFPTVASFISTVAYNYMPSHFSAYSGQYHLSCCLLLHAFSFLCLQWPVSPLLLPTTACILFSVPTVASSASIVAYSYVPSPPTLHSAIITSTVA